jgi:hypothetical protein
MGSSPFPEESLRNYTTGRIDFPEDSGATKGHKNRLAFFFSALAGARTFCLEWVFFVKVSEGDRELLREAIERYGKK